MTDLTRLAKITELLYARERNAARAVLDREAAISAELQKLIDVDRQARTQTAPASDAASSRMLFSWKSFRDEKTRKLNTQLAAARAEKEVFLEQLRTAYGKCIAVDELIKLQAKRENRLKCWNGGTEH